MDMMATRDRLINSTGLHYYNWHCLLTRTLGTYLKDPIKGNPPLRLASLLAVLASLPVPEKVSDRAIAAVLPRLFQFLRRLDYNEILNGGGADNEDELLASALRAGREFNCPLHDHDGNERRKVCNTKKTTDEGDSEEDDNGEDLPKKSTTRVFVNECVLMSDSDGFAGFAGETVFDNSLDRDSVDEKFIYVIFHDVFGSYPSVIPLVETLLNAVAVIGSFSVIDNIPRGMKFYCDNFSAAAISHLSGGDRVSASPQLFRKCRNVRRLVYQVAQSIISLIDNSDGMSAVDVTQVLSSGSKFLLGHLKSHIMISTHLSVAYSSGIVIDEVQVAAVEETIRWSNDAALQLLRHVLYIMALCDDGDGMQESLKHIGEAIVVWAEDPMSAPIIEHVIDCLECDFLHCERVDEKMSHRFAFELLASLLEFWHLTSLVLHRMLCTMPCGFKNTVSGSELLNALNRGIGEHATMSAKILRRHLPFMNWSQPGRCLSFSNALTAMSSSSTSISSAIRTLCEILKSSTPDDFIVVTTSVLPYCTEVDMEYILMESTIPSLEEHLQEYRHSREEKTSTDEINMNLKNILKKFELIAAFLSTQPAASLLLSSVLYPFRDLFYASSELSELFGVALVRSLLFIRKMPPEVNFADWLVDCFDTGLKHISPDIWMFVSDSAVEYYKQLQLTVTILCDLLDVRKDLFSSHQKRLLSQSSRLVDLCFDWLATPSQKRTRGRRVTELMTKGLSIHLFMDKDANDVMKRFRAGLLEHLGQAPSSALLNSVVNSLLQRGASRQIANNFRGSNASIDQDTEDEILITEGGFCNAKCVRRIVHPSLIPMAINVLTNVLNTRERLDEDDEYTVISACGKLRDLDGLSNDGNQWIPHLFALLDVVETRSESPSMLSSLLELIGEFVRRDTKTADLNRLLQVFSSGRCKLTAITAIEKLFETQPIGPEFSLSFPQPKMLPPDEIKEPDDYQLDYKRQMKDAEEKALSPTNIIKAMERLLSKPSHSDCETDSERRSERKKMIKKHLNRGSSLASIDHRCKTEASTSTGGATEHHPPAPLIPSEAAANFTLHSSHEVLSPDGLSVAFWIRTAIESKASTKTLPNLHLLSIGGCGFSCEATISKSGFVYFTLTSSFLTMERRKLKGKVVPGEWTAIVIGTKVSADTITVQGMVGDCYSSLTIPLLVQLHVATFPFTVSFGCVRKRSYFSYFMSSLFGFKGLLPASCCIVFQALGCQITSLSDAHVSRLVPNLFAVLRRKVAQKHMSSLEALRGDVMKYAKKLQRSVVFHVKASSSNNYGVSILPPDIEPDSIIGQSALLLAYVKSFPITWCSTISLHRTPSLDGALTPLGGIKVLIYMFVKSINDELPEEVQHAALRVLLSAMKRGAFTDAVEALRVNAVIARALASETAHLTWNVTETILRHCVEMVPLTDPLVIVDSMSSSSDSDDEEDSSSMDASVAVVRCPKLLCEVLTRAELWKPTERRGSWRRLTSFLCRTVSATSCRFHELNRMQLREAGMLQKFFNCILELIEADSESDSDEANCDVFVDEVTGFVQALLGNPETTDSVRMLWHFIFLSHRANHCYIDHRVLGHTEWLNPAYVKDDYQGTLQGESKLGARLRSYVEVLGRDYIIERMQKGDSLFDLRREYEQRALEADASLHASSLPASDSSASVEEQKGVMLRNLSSSESVLSVAPSNGVVLSTASDSDTQLNNADKTSSSSGLQQQYHASEFTMALRASLMNLLAMILQNGADSLLACLRHDVISWQAQMAMLTHQKNARVRDAAVNILEKFLLRSPISTKVSFLQLQGAKMLASQLCNAPVSQNIVDSLFSLLCGETIRLGDGLDEEHLKTIEVDRLSCEMMYPIFVAFEESVPDVALFWNVTNSLMKVFEYNSQLQMAMLDASLIDVLVNVLRRIAFLDPKSDCEVIFDGVGSSYSAQLEAWSSFAQRIVISAVPFNEPKLYAQCERFVQLLFLADTQCLKEVGERLGVRLQAHKIIRSQLCLLLHVYLGHVRSVFSDEGKSASCTSSVDSLNIGPHSDSPSSSSSASGEFDLCEDIVTPEKASQMEGIAPAAVYLKGRFADLKEKLLGTNTRRLLKCPYAKRNGPSPLASAAVLTARMTFALDYISYVMALLTPTEVVTDEENSLFHFYLYFLLSSWKKEFQSSPRANASGGGGGATSGANSPQSTWQRVVVMCRERVRVLLAQLVAFVLFPAQRKCYEALASMREVEALPNWKSAWTEKKRRLVAKALTNEIGFKQSLNNLISVNLDYEYALCIAIYELAVLSPCADDCEADVDKMIRYLQSCRVGFPFDKFSEDSLNNLTTDEILTMHTFCEYRKEVLVKLRNKMEAIRDAENKLTAAIGETAMEVTCEIVEQFNVPRKQNILSTKTRIGEFVSAERTLNDIVRELCHPEAPNYEERHWPIGWALDPTEGPMRERRRLMPFNYPFEARFFHPAHQHLANRVCEEPLARLLSSSAGRPRKENVSVDEPIRLYLDATVLRGTFECEGELLMGDKQLYFVGERAKSTQKGTDCSVITLSWRYEQLEEVHMRNHQLKDVALEVFISNGDTYLIVFESKENRLLFLEQLSELIDPEVVCHREQKLQVVMHSWRQGQLTNFQYLMELNKLAGRSFNDLMQYPVFPFVLADYTSAVLDLGDPACYRNLERPMAVQDKRMEAHYISNYNSLKAECDQVGAEISALHFGPYHYGSHYSNSGIVTHFLVRLSPFTQIALEYQDHNFDIPDRLFNSIEATWRLASNESTTDFKELTPEFFSLPEFLENRNDLNLGVRQTGEVVDGVRLPTWTPEGNARLFVMIHRQALESPLVSQALHSWIDLIFGFKQTGKAALDAVNVFHPATYTEHLDVDKITDELSQSALRTMVKSYGQMPIQLLHAPHQPHLTAGREKKESAAAPSIPSPLPSVISVRWGDYVGSPEQSQSQIQTILSYQAHGEKARRIWRVLTLADGNAVGVPRFTTLLSTLGEPQGKNPAALKELAAISHSFDGMLRFRLLKPTLKPWVNLIDLGLTEVSVVEYCGESKHLFVAYQSGLIDVYRLLFDSEGVTSMRHESSLIGHYCSVQCLYVCAEYKIVVSASSDGKVIVWDSNRLSFVRVLRPSGDSAVTAICCSRTTGDVVVVSQKGYGSLLQMFTINGDLVGAMDSQSTIVCVAMTNQNEGTAINCVVVGLQDGRIQLIETWCFTCVREIFNESHREPITHVSMPCGGRKLFAVNSTGRVLCWQAVPSMTKAKAPQFQIVNPHEY